MLQFNEKGLIPAIIQDAEIDQKVYELYGLTEEERQVIETSLAKTVL